MFTKLDGTPICNGFKEDSGKSSNFRAYCDSCRIQTIEKKSCGDYLLNYKKEKVKAIIDALE